MTSKQSFKPKVNEIQEFLEVASDFESPYELIREALSNSYDAHASKIEISIDLLDDGPYTESHSPMMERNGPTRS